ncbi:MAG: peptidase S24 [Patescibacteria group bacterium]|nr:peptidase S24 [Patescibacteria group bacterium]
MKALHEKQEKLLGILKKNFGDPLTIRDLQALLEVSSTSVVYHHLIQLEKKGYLKRNPYNPQDFQIIADEPEKQVTFLNLYGQGACNPKGSILDDKPIDRIAISSRMISFPVDQAYILRAKGDSMAPKINDGDLVMVQKANSATSGDIVVCVNNSEVLIKKIIYEGKQVILESINNSYSPFLANIEEFHIEGKARGVISYM